MLCEIAAPASFFVQISKAFSAHPEELIKRKNKRKIILDKGCEK